MTDWNQHEDAIDDAISDSIDMDWTSRTGAKAVVAWLNENATSMTRDAEHTPSPQSVVVPIDLAETPAIRNALGLYRSAILCGEQWSDACRDAYLAALKELDQLAILAAAPAPSSLAGGEWNREDHGNSTLLYTLKERGWRKGEPIMVNDKTVRIEFDGDREPVIAAILAALSPEAPALDGAETGWLIEGYDSKRGAFKAQWWGLHADLDEDGQGWTTDSLKALRFARSIDAQTYIDNIGWTEAKPTEHQWVVPGGGENLRAQPQAREEAQPWAWWIASREIPLVVTTQDKADWWIASGALVTPLSPPSPPAPEAEKLRAALSKIAHSHVSNAKAIALAALQQEGR